MGFPFSRLTFVFGLGKILLIFLCAINVVSILCFFGAFLIYSVIPFTYGIEPLTMCFFSSCFVLDLLALSVRLMLLLESLFCSSANFITLIFCYWLSVSDRFRDCLTSRLGD